MEGKHLQCQIPDQAEIKSENSLNNIGWGEGVMSGFLELLTK